RFRPPQLGLDRDRRPTAIISAAGLINALKVVGKDISKVKIVVNGAGASAISCTRLFIKVGIDKNNLVMLDSKGVINTSREDLDETKKEFITERTITTLEEAMKDADVFVGLSKADIVSQAMVQSMAKDPIVFAMANPNPEIAYDLAIASRPDLIMATGRSDHPNQVNNVLGFPFIFRGALDVRATKINEEMKLAAVYAIAELALEPVPDIVNMAYNQKNISFGREYIIPKPLDPRLITTVSPAVAKAAMDSGVAKLPITDWDKYNDELLARLGKNNEFVRVITTKAKANPKRVLFAEADNYKILKSAEIAKEEGIAIPVLLGNKEKITQLIAEHNLGLKDVEIIDQMAEEAMREEFAQIFFEKRQRKGITLHDARKLMRERNYFGSMMLLQGKADALISGLTRNYPSTIRPALQIIGKDERVNKVAGMYIMMTKKGVLFFADTTVNTRPTAEDLADITILTAKAVKSMNITPRVAMLSYTNFGSTKGDTPGRVQKARQIVKERNPELICDGDLQANFALNPQLLQENFPFSELAGGSANTLIFPSLSAGNICYKMLQELGTAEAIGPVLLGMKKPVHIVQLGSSVREIVNMITIAVIDAQERANS
ncbi:MAG: NADP-dependent malic enzyme, partial [Bacteroidetes bacterium]|nr:NADP-dependent malic enzyme [Bacteroidota bacterium]